MAIVIREATKRDIALLTGLIRESFRDVAERFGLTPENCPSHPSNCTEAGPASRRVGHHRRARRT